MENASYRYLGRFTADCHLGASLIFPAQDLDAEEQGIRRSQEGIGDAFEMVALNKNAESDEAFLSPRRRNEHALDAYYSGDVVIAHIDFTETVRTAWQRRYGI